MVELRKTKMWADAQRDGRLAEYLALSAKEPSGSKSRNNVYIV